MAFDFKEKETDVLQAHVRSAIGQAPQVESNVVSVVRPKKTSKDSERKRAYTFTLRPSTRQKLTRLAEEDGYQSVSEYLNDLIDGM